MTHWKLKAREIYKAIMISCGRGIPAPDGKEFVRRFKRFDRYGLELKELLETGITSEERQLWFKMGVKSKVHDRFKQEIKALQSVGKRLQNSKDPDHFRSMFKDAEWNFYFGPGRPFAGLQRAKHLAYALNSTIDATEQAVRALDRVFSVDAFFEEAKARAEEKLAKAQAAADNAPMTPEQEADLKALFELVDPDKTMILGPSGQPADRPVKLHGPQPEQPPDNLPTIIT